LPGNRKASWQEAFFGRYGQMGTAGNGASQEDRSMGDVWMRVLSQEWAYNLRRTRETLWQKETF
jgi:hypothetical protein